jgi:hypothetical protein
MSSLPHQLDKGLFRLQVTLGNFVDQVRHAAILIELTFCISAGTIYFMKIVMTSTAQSDAIFDIESLVRKHIPRIAVVAVKVRVTRTTNLTREFITYLDSLCPLDMPRVLKPIIHQQNAIISALHDVILPVLVFVRHELILVPNSQPRNGRLLYQAHSGLPRSAVSLLVVAIEATGYTVLPRCSSTLCFWCYVIDSEQMCPLLLATVLASVLISLEHAGSIVSTPLNVVWRVVL